VLGLGLHSTTATSAASCRGSSGQVQTA
jgi:hypothetical protein